MGGNRNGSGRKAINIDLGALEKMCALQCTDQEIACFFEVNVRTIERRKKTVVFGAAMERGRARGRLSVRRALFAQSAKGSVAATIFLAKNLLGYKDYSSSEHTGPEGGPIPVSLVEILQQRRNRLAAQRKLAAGNGSGVPTNTPESKPERSSHEQPS